MKTSKSLGAIVLIIGVAWAQKPADQGAPSRDHQTPSAAAIKPAELKTQAYRGTLMDASCAPASKESGGKAAAADQSQGCRVSASTKEFALRTDSAETFRFDSVGNARAEEAIKNKKNWSTDAAAGKPIRAKVIANANGDKLTVMSIN